MEKLLKLSDAQKLNVVREWYLNIPEILQSEDGVDLEELCENNLDLGTDIQENTIKKLKLYNLEVLIVVSMWYSNQPILFYTENDDYLDNFIMEKIQAMLFEFGKIN
jgi:hypothetical protein